MYRIVLTYSFALVQDQVNRNFQLVLNENVPVGQVGHGISTALLKGELLLFCSKKRYLRFPVEFEPSRPGSYTDVVKFQSSKGENLILKVEGQCK